MTPKQTVEHIYAAFGCGDIPAILERLSQDVAWDEPPQSTTVPWLQPRRGREGAQAFFATLAGLEFPRFDIKAILEGPRLAVAILDVELVIKASGQRVLERDEVHLWEFDEAGLVSRFRHRIDTRAMQLAWAGTR